MSAVRFVDTNILIYAASPAPHEADKQNAAQRLLEAGDLALSVQVLQEFYHQATAPTAQSLGRSPSSDATLL